MRSVTVRPRLGNPFVVLMDGSKVIHGGEIIGRVEKGSRAYSPPMRRGSRIVKYHKTVPCWYAFTGELGRNPYRFPHDTRNDAILSLLPEGPGQ